ncbi:MAG: sulfite exporter TauE/SafE family protein [Lacisediminihabitans sp.]
MSALLALPLGLLIGAALGLVGAGGSILAVPALVYGVGLRPAEAIPSSLVVVGLAALFAVLPRIRHGVDWTTAAIVGIAGIPAAWLGAAVNRALDPNVLMLAFAALMVIAAIRMLATGRRGTAPARPEPRNLRAHLPKALAVGALVGFLTGLLGVGGGFIITPALVLLLGLGMGTAVGTSLVIIVINSIAGFSAHIQNLAINWPIVITFAATAIVGSLVAARFATKLADKHIKITFAVMILVVAAFVTAQSGYALATA